MYKFWPRKEFEADIFYGPVISQMVFAAVDIANFDQLLRHLSVVDQDYHCSPTQSPSCRELPRFYWIFRNMDYEQWWSAKGSRALWLCGPAECNISDASACIVGLAKETPSEAQHSALYFFCSTLTAEDPAVVTFVSTIVHQLVCCVPQLKEQVTKVFLRTLVKAILCEDPKQSSFKLGDSAEAIAKKILKTSSEGYWSALEAVMGLEREQGLFLVIDGLEKAGREFTREFNNLSRVSRGALPQSRYCSRADRKPISKKYLAGYHILNMIRKEKV